MIYTIKPNCHFSTPRTPKIWVKNVRCIVKFDQPVYDLKSTDQADWNKLTGISFNPFKPDETSIMVAWRWNLTLKKVEVAPFFNVNGSPIYAELGGFKIHQFNIGEEIPIRIDYNGIYIDNWFQPISSQITPIYASSFRNQPYFGGNRTNPGPNNILITITYL